MAMRFQKITAITMQNKIAEICSWFLATSKLRSATIPEYVLLQLSYETERNPSRAGKTNPQGRRRLRIVGRCLPEAASATPAKGRRR